MPATTSKDVTARTARSTSTTASSIDGILDRFHPEVVYHLAGWSDVGGSWKAPEETFRANAEGTLNVLLACRDARRRAGAVDIERRRVRHRRRRRAADRREPPPAPGDAVRREQGRRRLPRTAGVARLEGCRCCGCAPSTTSARVRVRSSSRPRSPSASPSTSSTAAPRFRSATCQPARDFTDVRDVVRAYRLLIEHGEPGEAYNVCSGVDVAIADLADRCWPVPVHR